MPEQTGSENQLTTISAKESPIEWKLTDKDISFARSNLKHGLCASIPITCGGEDHCPYKENCAFVLTDGVEPPMGGKCPVEIAMVEALVMEYKRDIAPKNTSITILTIIRDLVDVDMMLERARKLVSAQGDLVEDVCSATDQDGNPIYRPEITKAVEAWDKMLGRRERLLDMLGATPKARMKYGNMDTLDPGTYSARLVKQLRKLEKLEAENAGTTKHSTVDIASEVVTDLEE